MFPDRKSGQIEAGQLRALQTQASSVPGFRNHASLSALDMQREPCLETSTTEAFEPGLFRALSPGRDKKVPEFFWYTMRTGVDLKHDC